MAWLLVAALVLVPVLFGALLFLQIWGMFHGLREVLDEWTSDDDAESDDRSCDR